MRLAIVGSRHFHDIRLLNMTMEQLIKEWGMPDEIVSGGAPGADTLAEHWAEAHDIPCIVYEANWDLYGRAAGPKRNARIVEYCTHLLAFCSVSSRGTRNSIKLMEATGKPLHVVKIK